MKRWEIKEMKGSRKPSHQGERELLSMHGLMLEVKRTHWKMPSALKISTKIQNIYKNTKFYTECTEANSTLSAVPELPWRLVLELVAV